MLGALQDVSDEAQRGVLRGKAPHLRHGSYQQQTRKQFHFSKNKSRIFYSGFWLLASSRSVLEEEARVLEDQV